MKPRKRVALIIETSNEYARGLLHGIRAYIREHDPWAIYFSEQSRGESLDWLEDFDGDGIIARIETREIAQAVTAKGLPTIDVSAARHVPDLPWVETDNLAIARLAAEHLLGRGLRHFGFCGAPMFNWSRERSDHFERLIRDVYPRGIVSIVSDTWDFWQVITDFMPRLKYPILQRDGKVVKHMVGFAAQISIPQMKQALDEALATT